ncbi:hypothetical protein GWK47_045627 [Chionoecetes opilio]|uniref:FAS1 domain-containing protein n=1 Tax=Chionoecetes opilio TaxID=41210 RepID=A0A8J4Y5F4_CHIOP|nr:hypothetical protein GWK47_045627 [Chionoecetes opilio]
MARRSKLTACPWLLILLLVKTTAAQESPPKGPAIPLMTEALKEVYQEYRRDGSSFWNLWRYALEHDAPSGPVIRGTGGSVKGKKGPLKGLPKKEAKTVLAPSVTAEAHLTPHDSSDVRFGSTPALQALRRHYLADHLLTEPLAPSDPRLPNGVTLNTVSGKEVTITKDDMGVITVNGVAAERTASLPDGTHVYILSDILFDNRRRVTSAYQRHHAIDLANDPLGPPLDLPHLPVIRAPAPPPPGTPGIPRPPAIPRPHERAASPSTEPRPPAIPSGHHAPLTPRNTDPPASPPAGPPADPVLRGPDAPPRTPELEEEEEEEEGQEEEEEEEEEGGG